ncbi:MAG: hypothetical protein IKI20_06300 [Lachnospiraceae bacterium]|nr:hypothetical protein [Lachnospiraceae bacterium]
MACFLVSAAEAIVVKAVEKGVEKKESASHKEGELQVEETHKIPFSRKLKWLCRMLCGGSVLLAFEHVWHGEVVPWFPFLTAASDPNDAAEMLHEMSTVGVAMAVLVTVVWIGMCVVADVIVKRPEKNIESSKAL